jgi:hypothetical protein
MGEMTKQRYITILAEDYNDFDQKVSVKMEEGYLLHGDLIETESPVQTSGFWLRQAMILPSPAPAPPISGESPAVPDSGESEAIEHPILQLIWERIFESQESIHYNNSSAVYEKCLEFMWHGELYEITVRPIATKGLTNESHP